MFCKKCGKEIEEGKVLCEECEAVEEKVEETQEVTEEQEIFVVEEAGEQQEEIEEKPESPKENKGKGLFALIAGFSSLYIPAFNTIFAILAIIFGAMSRKTKSKTLGTVGMVAGIMYFVSQVTAIIIVVLVYAYIILIYLLVFIILIASGEIVI